MPANIEQLLTGELYSVDLTATAAEVVSLMRHKRISCVPVVDDAGIAVGIMTERDVMRLIHRSMDMNQTVATVMSHPVRTASSDTSIFDAYELLKRGEIRHLVVTRHGLAAGVLTHSDLMRAVGMFELLQRKSASDIMLSSVARIASDDLVQEVIALMVEREVTSVVITHERRPVGIITERDIPVVLERVDHLHTLTAADVMSSPVQMVQLNTSAYEAAEKLRRNHIRQLVVIDHDGCMAGIITQSSLLMAFDARYVEHMRNQLQLAQERLSQGVLLTNIMNSAIDTAIMALDCEMMIVIANPAAAAMFSSESDMFIGLKWQQAMEQARFTAPEPSVIVGEIADHGTCKHMITSSGEDKRSIEITVSAIWEKDEKLGYLLLARDITERLNREQERDARMQQLRTLSGALDAAGEGIMITDPQGVIQYVNPALCLQSGYAADELVGQTPARFKSGRQEAAFYTAMWQRISSGHIWEGKLVDRRKNGDMYHVLMSIAPVFDESGSISNYVGIQQDMTDHAMLEEQLRQSQKMESIGTLVGGIAHDFNNMLAGMTGNLYLARTMLGTHPAVSRLAVVEELGFRAAKMIQQLLTFARKDSIQMKPVRLTSFLQEVLDLNRLAIPESIPFYSSIIERELIVLGDETQLQQVVINLLTNAHDAVSGQQSPLITLRLDEYIPDAAFRSRHPSPDESVFARLTVADNGCGIPEEKLGKIFDPFYTTKEVGKGTGLGLSMVYGAVQSHRGIIEVESGEGRGAHFHIYLPLLGEEVRLQLDEEPCGVVNGHGEMILLVDDEASVRETGQAVLENLNYQVLTAVDGEQAVEIFAANPAAIDLVILDLVMPRLGGWAAASRIKSIRADIPVLLATGYDREDALKQNTLDEGAVVIGKPYQVSELSRILRELLYQP
ncbi:CBS domain-containing protein [Mariprofundus erugo]|uniref:CBS domain-containing protein n=1 Tax=Mariprofundus erugo TaxID=2528639 RepID=UPI0013873959|nr:CBS domain-containing protein [Mariprofundus erugo]